MLFAAWPTGAAAGRPYTFRSFYKLSNGALDIQQYTGTIEGVAQPSYQLRALPGGYVLAITR